MKTATIVGYHGYRNFGDDIFLRITCRWLRKSMDVSSCFLCVRKAGRESLLSGIKLIPFANPYNRISRLIWLPIFFKAIKSDYLVFSAGSIFTIQPFFLIYMVLKILKILRGGDLQILAIGVSIGPFNRKRDEYWCARSLALMHVVLVRDIQSQKRIDNMDNSIRSTLSYDLALCWENTTSNRHKEKKSILIGLAMTKRGFGNCGMEHSQNCNFIYEALVKVLTQYEHVRLRIFCICSDKEDGDQWISNHFQERLAKWDNRIEMVVYNGENADDVLASISECSLMIASRMHAGIMAMLASIPVYQVSYAEKIRNFFVHSELSTNSLYDHNEMSMDSITDFLFTGLARKLEKFGASQCKILHIKGEHVRKCINNLAKEIRSQDNVE